VTVESEDLEGSFGVCAAELTPNQHHVLTRQTWNVASQKFGPEHLYSRGRTCAIHVTQLASRQITNTLQFSAFDFFNATVQVLQAVRTFIRLL
jgi:hypothetical protein